MKDKIITEKTGIYNLKEANFLGKYYEEETREVSTDFLIKDLQMYSSGKVSSIESFFQLNPDIPKIDNSNWAAFVDLCFHYVKTGQKTSNYLNRKFTIDLSLEVRCQIWIDVKKDSYVFVVPEQTVTSASASTVGKKGCNLLTGEFVSLPLEGDYIYIGQVHSHNTMPLASFSSIDDQDELSRPGLYFLVHSINQNKATYGITASVVWNHTRYYVEWKNLIEDSSKNETKFHANCLSIIKEQSFPSPVSRVTGNYTDQYFM